MKSNFAMDCAQLSWILATLMCQNSQASQAGASRQHYDHGEEEDGVGGVGVHCN